MEYYKNLRKLRESLVLIPGLKSYKDFDISIEIGHYEHLGTPVTLKQLLSFNIASEATVRRHLNQLIKTGMVKKEINPADHRSIVFTLTDKSHQLFQNCMDELTSSLKDLL